MKNQFLKMVITFGLVFGATSSFGFFPEVGAKAGIGINHLEFNASGVNYATDNNTKFYGGVFLENDFLPPLFKLQVEANYFVFGSGQTALAIPILAKAKFDAGPVRPYIMAGPEFLFKLKDDSNTAKSFALGLDIGGGLEYWFAGNIALLAEARYAFGVTNAADTVVSATNVSAKIRSFQLLAGLAFSL